MALIDQFTVKSKIQKQSQNTFISLLLDDHYNEANSKYNSYLFRSLKICLFSNFEPQYEAISMENKRTIYKKDQASISDAKLFNKLHENFIEKLNFTQ